MDALIIITFIILLIFIAISSYFLAIIKKRIEEVNDKYKRITDEMNKSISLNNDKLSKALLILSENLETHSLNNQKEQKDLVNKITEEMDNQNSKLETAIANIKQIITEEIDNQNSKLTVLNESINVSIDNIVQELSKKIIDNQLEQQKIFAELSTKIKDNRIENINSIQSILDTLTALNEEYKDLTKKVNFFANIEEDSSTLNDVSKTEAGIIKEKELLETALSQLKKTEVTPYHSSENLIIDNRTNEVEEKTIQNIEECLIETIVENEILPNDDKPVPSMFDESQKEAFKIMTYSNDNLLITGRAGTGKSFLLNVFSNSTNKKILVLAPTGIAALNVGGATVHSAFGYKNLVETPIDELNTNILLLKSDKRSVLKNVDTIIVDEISMLRSDVLEKMNKILQILNNSSMLFGGKQMIFIGDPFQLPPVVKRNEQEFLNDNYGGEFFFNAPCYKKGNFKFVELATNHRQNSDPEFFNVLNHIREGKMRKQDMELLNSRVVDADDENLNRIIRLFATKTEVDLTNNSVLSKIPGGEYEFETIIEYQKENRNNINIDSNFPFPQVLKLKIGANVMFIVNDKDKRWVNGTIGIIKRLTNDLIRVVVDKKEFDVERVSFSQKDAIYKEGKILYEDVLRVKQFPIILSYAITIHKSQGMTYPNIACDLSNCFEYGQEYVALSRVTSLKGLHLLEKIENDDISVAPQIRDFYWNCLLETKKSRG